MLLLFSRPFVWSIATRIHRNHSNWRRWGSLSQPLSSSQYLQIDLLECSPEVWGTTNHDKVDGPPRLPFKCLQWAKALTIDHSKFCSECFCICKSFEQKYRFNPFSLFRIWFPIPSKASQTLAFFCEISPCLGVNWCRKMLCLEFKVKR